jgi:N-acetylglucosaminyldiphosphoundecaprenol N-acetyl-beta-D-mannosaminyltransferase
MGVPIHDVTTAETVAYIARWIDQGGAYPIATVNPEFLMKARADSAFRAALNRAALCVPDGIGVLWAVRLRGRRLRERVAGSDLVPLLSAEAARRGWRVFYLGAAPGVAERTAEILAARHPGLPVAGCYAGSPAPEEEDGIVARVRAARTDLLFVAYGAPRQDLWLDRNLARTGAAVGIGVGGAFDFVAGVATRAPRWVQRLGLEWLHRLACEPWRWRRQLALPAFAWRVLTGRDAPEG